MKWVEYISDHHGFVNQIDSNNGYDEIEMALIGDSFTQGVCVEAKDNISSRLIAEGFNTLNFGIGGRGPGSELVTRIVGYVPDSDRFGHAINMLPIRCKMQAFALGSDVRSAEPLAVEEEDKELPALAAV